VHEEFAQFLSEASAKPHAIEHLKDYLRRINQLAASEAGEMRHRREADSKRAQEQMKELIRMKVDKLISDEEFHEQRRAIVERIALSGSVDEALDAGRLDSILSDLDAVSGYLMNLADAWKRVSPDFQRRFQQITIPAGYSVGAIGTAQKGRILSFIGSSLPEDTYLVPPACESWNQLVGEISGLAEVFRESCRGM
jgi:hypothetical protein